jgi:hypothetical protein
MIAILSLGIMSAPVIAEDLGQALKNCLAQSFTIEKDEKEEYTDIKILKVNVDGENRHELDLACTGEAAAELFELLEPLSLTRTEIFSDSSKHLVRKLSSKNNSKCFRKLSTANGSEANDYRCYIQLDLDPTIISNMNI